MTRQAEPDTSIPNYQPWTTPVQPCAYCGKRAYLKPDGILYNRSLDGEVVPHRCVKQP